MTSHIQILWRDNNKVPSHSYFLKKKDFFEKHSSFSNFVKRKDFCEKNSSFLWNLSNLLEKDKSRKKNYPLNVGRCEKVIHI